MKANLILGGLISVAVLGLADGALGASGAEEANPVGQSFVYKISGGQEQRMEIFFPPAFDPVRSRVPGMILFHGGDWRNGSLDDFRFAAAYFASRGIVCATADYQMLDDADRARLPAGESRKRVCVVDARSAVRWFKRHAAEFGVDADRIIVGGGSAGAHISALATINPTLADPTDPEDDGDVNAVAYVWFNPAFAPSDRADPSIDILAHLDAKLPPTLVMFGDQDIWKPGWDVAQQQWESLGVSTIELLIAPGKKHAFFRKGAWRLVTLRAVDEFLTAHGFLAGQPTLPVPVTGEHLVRALR